MANCVDLCDLPSDLCEIYLPYNPTLRQRQKAHAFSRNSYVHSVKISGNKNVCEIDISAKVYRSQRKSDLPHAVNMTINTATKTVTEGYCSCKAGISGECAHLLATIMTLRNWILEGYKEVPAEQSCTSLPQMWDKPRGNKIKPEPVTQMVICKPTKLDRKRKPLMTSFHDNRINTVTSEDIKYLQKLSGCPISYLAQECKKSNICTTYGPQYIGSGLSYHAPLMNPVKPPADSDHPCGDLVFPAEIDVELPSVVTDNAQSWNHLKTTKEESVMIEKETRSQSESEKWKKERKQRITASSFGKIIKRKSVINNKFMKALFKSQYFVTKPTAYGKANEKVAKQLYIRKTKNHAHEIGLIVNPKLPFLGATPDGKVCDKGESGILEIKCPYSVRDMTLVEACSDVKYGGSFFLQQFGQELKLKTNHEYWYQVQGQLKLSGAPFCDFVTYTKRDLNIQRIKPDMDTFNAMLQKLTSIYLQHVKSYLECDDNDKDGN